MGSTRSLNNCCDYEPFIMACQSVMSFTFLTLTSDTSHVAAYEFIPRIILIPEKGNLESTEARLEEPHFMAVKKVHKL